MMQYDVAAKVVVEHGKEAILRWLLGVEAEYVELIEELPQETATLRRSDFPLLVKPKDGKEKIVLLEFQTVWKREVPIRLLEYVARFKLKYRLPVLGVVLLFRKREGIEEVYEDESIRFKYRLIKLWKTKADDVLNSQELWLYPFIPVMESEKSDIIEAEEGIYKSSLERRDKADLLTAIFRIQRGRDSQRIIKKEERHYDRVTCV